MGVLFTLLMKFIVSITNFFLYPANTIIVDYFPDFAQTINRFNALVGQLITNKIAYWFYILPSNTRNAILFYLALLLAINTISLALHVVIKVITIIKNVKIW